MIEQNIGIGAAFVAGLISFISPCVLPLVPVFITYVSGVAGPGTAIQPAADPARSARKTVFLHTLSFVLGFSAVFILLGASATAVGRSLFSYQKWFAAVGGTLVALLGLFMLGLLPLNFLMKDIRVHLRQKPAGLAGSFLVGGTFGFGWTPCIGPILGAILLLASTAEAVWQGMFLLAIYSLGLAIPFLISAVLFERVLGTFRRLGRFSYWAEKVCGGILVVVGILVATGQFARITGWMLQAFGPWVDWLIKLEYKGI